MVMRSILVKSLLLIAFSLPALAQEAADTAKLNADLIYKSIFGTADEVSKLIEQGANPNALDEKGVPAMAHAAKRKDDAGLEIIKALSAGGGNKDVVDSRGQTPLFYAAASGNMEAIKLLLEMGVDFYHVDKNGDVARNLAFKENHKEAFEYMDNFVNEKRNAVQKEYEEFYKRQQEAKSPSKETAVENNIENIYASQDATEVADPVIDQGTLSAVVNTLAMNTCQYQYWHFVKSVDLKAEIDLTQINALLVQYKTVADQASAMLVNDMKTNPKNVTKVINSSKKKIYNDLKSYGSNITRRSKGIGTMADAEQRCARIASDWLVYPAN